VGDSLLGRVIDPLGMPLDGKGAVVSSKFRPIEAEAPAIFDRQGVKQPLETGIMAIDSMIPIGKGQRELIIGDRQTGKTAIAVDTILNQKGKHVICVYVAIGQKASTISAIIRTLELEGAMDYTVVVASTGSDTPSMQYIAPYSGCAIAEEFMYSGRDVLIVYDDLSKHAWRTGRCRCCCGVRRAGKRIPGTFSICTRGCWNAPRSSIMRKAAVR
jgi:F-type H+-transporting ATPase subunit alpha